MPSPPNYTPIYIGSGGGLFGALKARFLFDGDLKAMFVTPPNGTPQAGKLRVVPGRVSPGMSLPYVVLTHVSCILDDYMNAADSSAPEPLDIWKETFQTSVVADNYEAARQIARLVHSRVSRQTLVIDFVPCFIWPLSRMIVLEALPNRSESGGDLWRVDTRYYYWTGERVLIDSYVYNERQPAFGPPNTMLAPEYPSEPAHDV